MVLPEDPIDPGVSETTKTTVTPLGGATSASGHSESSQSAGGAGVVSNVQKLEGDVKVAQEINETRNQLAENVKGDFKLEIENLTYLLGDGQGFSRTVTRTFTFKEDRRITEKEREELSSLFVADSGEIERLRCLLVEKRVLVLSGEAELGKRATAIYLSGLIASCAVGEDVSDNDDTDGAKARETYVIPPLERHLRIDLHSDILANRFAIFRNAFDRGNPDLLGFFAQLDPSSLGRYADHLKKINSYLIFTITPSEASHLRPSLADCDLRHELQHLNDELLLKGLEQKLARLAQEPRVSAERLKQLQEPEQQRFLIARLRTMPRIIRFVDKYTRESGAADARVELGEAIRRFEDIPYWFQHNFTSDFEAWCFALSLGLAHCLGESQGVSWIDFECLRRAVRHCLRRDPELFPPVSGISPQLLVEPSEKAPTLIDDVYLEKSRARILKDPSGLTDLIRFNEESYSPKLWEILLKHHRRILTMLLPCLRAIAEDHSGEYDPRQRALCAQIIGRIGEIDPDRITFGQMTRWLSSDNVRHRAAIGTLYQGIFASEDERYHRYFLKLLDTLAATDTTGVSTPEEKKHILTAIAVYAQIGHYDLSLAMKGLEGIARARLVPVMREVQNIGRFIERTQKKFAERLSAEETLTLLVYQEMFRDLAERLFNQQAGTFVGVQYALCSLALSTDPTSVFRELRQWIESSDQATGVLVALMFLIKDGIAATLGSRQVEMSDDESAAAELKTCNPMLAALTFGQEGVLEMARFLTTVYESFTATFILPKEFAWYLRESFLLHLERWVDESLPIESCRTGMVNLFAELMRIHGGILFEPIYQLLHKPEFNKGDSDSKKSFVDEVLWARH
jgi:hypothetical protein